MGFLWFNVHPAQVIMGDSGSLGLGAALAVTALITGQILVLPLIGLVFVIETGSVILQVAYFKATGGKRIFRMSPIHHHFELLGWDEEKITVRFWIVGGPRRAARGDPVHGLDQLAGMTTMTTTAARRPSEPTARSRRAHPRGDPGRRACAGGRSPSSGFARSGIALARFLVDAGAIVTRLRRASGRRPARTHVAGSTAGPIRLLAGPGRRPGRRLARAPRS